MSGLSASVVTAALAGANGPVSMTELVERVQASTEVASSEIRGKVLSMIPQAVTLTPDRRLTLKAE
jgi:hypothetical protein